MRQTIKSGYLGPGATLMYSPGNGTATAIGFGAAGSVGSSSNLGGSLGGGYSQNQGSTGLGSW